MTEITSLMVKELREKTGAGMMQCKQALTETKGDLEGAVDFLRKKGLSVAAKKAGRVAAQGVVAVISNGTKGAMIELNSETDFVGKNTDFQSIASEMAKAALASGDVEAVKSTVVNGKNLGDSLTDLIAKIGENMNLRRAALLEVPTGVVTSYVHNAVAPGMGKIGVLVGLCTEVSVEDITPFAKQIAMHIAAAAPHALDVAGVDPAALVREKAIFTEQAKASGKPENIIEKMVEGRVRKFYEEVVLLEQAYVLDPDKKVKDVLAEVVKTFGKPVDLTGFVRYALGEGIEKKEEDFAQEVKKQLG